MVSGWGFRSRPLVEKHLDAIRQHFEIIPTHRQQVDQLIGDLRDQADVLIGVHIRHGDYARWEGGKYYYPVAKYVDVMRQIRQRLSGRRHAFLVCGNTDLRRDDFGDLNVRFGTGHLIEDMYSFAETDFLVGPPSTYTKWASLYGDVPLEFIEGANHDPRLENLPAGSSRAA